MGDGLCALDPSLLEGLQACPPLPLPALIVPFSKSGQYPFYPGASSSNYLSPVLLIFFPLEPVEMEGMYLLTRWAKETRDCSVWHIKAEILRTLEFAPGWLLPPPAPISPVLPTLIIQSCPSFLPSHPLLPPAIHHSI